MRILALLILCFVLFQGVSFADNLSSEFSKFEQKKKTQEKFEYKSKPRTSYHSKEPAKDNLGLERLKPVLNQMSGNRTDDGSNIAPSGSMSF